jgi:hypothetical protein
VVRSRERFRDQERDEDHPGRSGRRDRHDRENDRAGRNSRDDRDGYYRGDTR